MRSGAGSKNSSSSARCTSEPLVVATLGRSGSFSMLENRKASGQERNDSTREGDRLVGTAHGETVVADAAASLMM